LDTIESMTHLELLLPDEAATRDWAAALARAVAAQPLVKQAFVVHLSGDLGAGKTALARAMLRELGFSGPVKSPTFSLDEPYNLPNFSIYHFDLYRFSSSEQWFDAGFDDILASPGLMLLEWPENAAGALAAPDLLLELEATGLDDRRRLRVRAQTEAGRQCLARMTSTPAVPEA
jgi:tRNA threonylcarbamoyladenosine biosynthesis protein TsaE